VTFKFQDFPALSRIRNNPASMSPPQFLPTVCIIVHTVLRYNFINVFSSASDTASNTEPSPKLSNWPGGQVPELQNKKIYTLNGTGHIPLRLTPATPRHRNSDTPARGTHKLRTGSTTAYIFPPTFPADRFRIRLLFRASGRP